ncbi:hypothetical protein G5V59_19545 [Nocardioides sp. W3-2-3]|uniref:hypothetical protein n=1 Tax=Nocardioides convexus TaxID=2712224 RepID=UPI0024187E0F|nr:hypothetical protein [Nocardioides convexus]NHA01306.1 hypothetical protein [Nocardioides convexus]
MGEHGVRAALGDPVGGHLRGASTAPTSTTPGGWRRSWSDPSRPRSLVAESFARVLAQPARGPRAARQLPRLPARHHPQRLP